MEEPVGDTAAMARTWLAGPDDAPSVAGLLIGFRDWYGRSEPPDEAFAAGVERLIADPATDYLLAAAGDEPGGVCQLRYRYGLWYDALDCWLEDLYVRDADRRRGLGQALVEASIARARARGCGRIELDVSEKNPAAWRLYEQMGFSAEYKQPAPNVLMGLVL